MEIHLTRQSDQRRLDAIHSARVLGAKKAAFLYPSADGWQLYPLRPGCGVTVSGEPLAGLRKLARDDEILIDGATLQVNFASLGDAEYDSSLAAATTCEVVPDGGDRVVVDAPLLIGSARHCDLRLPNVEPVHALLTPASGGWLLHDLTGANKVAVKGQPPRRTVPLNGETRLRLGEARVTFRARLEGDADPVADTQTETPTEHTPAYQAADTVPEVAAVRDHRPDTTPAISTSSFSVMCLPDDIVYAQGVLLCRQLREGKVRSPGPLALGAVPPAKQAAWRELHALHQRLAAHPADPSCWREAARFFERQGHHDLCRVVLREMVKDNPKDSLALEALARAYFQCAQDEGRPAERRVQDYDHAGRYLQFLLRLSPRGDLADMQRSIGVESTLLRESLHRGESLTGAALE